MENDTFVISANKSRTILGLSLNVDITVKKTDIPVKYRLYVQSTSHNRKIPKNTYVLFKVSVKEALQNRLKENIYLCNTNQIP